jgi:hypothetical protein
MVTASVQMVETHASREAVASLVLYDWANDAHEVDIDLDDKDIVIAMLQILSGDEVLEVAYKNGMTTTIDSSDCRDTDFFDGAYVLVLNGEWVVDREKFLSRKGSYDEWMSQ